MKHKNHHHKHFKHLKKRIKRITLAVAGAAIMSAAMLPGMPTTVHASPAPSTASSRMATSPKTISTVNAANQEQTSPLVTPKIKPTAVARQAPEAQRVKNALNDKNTTTKAPQQGHSTNQADAKDRQNTGVKPPTDTQMSKNEKTDKPGKATETNKADQSSTKVPPSEKSNHTNEKGANSEEEKTSAKKSSGNTPEKYQQVLDITATAYAPGPHDNDQWGDKTYLGTNIRPGVIAVDPDVIPLGSRVYIEYPDGRGVYAVAEDTGGAIKGNRIDIAKWSVPEAEDFGMQKVKVYVLEKAKNT